MSAPTKVTVVSALLASAFSANAAIITLDLRGKAGEGLLPGNENFALSGTPGSGGEVGAGIFFNDVTRQLTINIAWGSINGFTNLTGNASAGHIHGPTPSSGSAAFLENVGVAIGLDGLAGWNPSANSGGFSGTVTLNATQATQLLDGRFYINVHTDTNSSGEIRGNIIVPEPSSLALAALSIPALLYKRRSSGRRSPGRTVC